LFDILTEVRGRQFNEPNGFSGSLPPLFLPICHCIFKANKYDDDNDGMDKQFESSKLNDRKALKILQRGKCTSRVTRATLC